jgi:hypothetical protein
MHPAFWILVKKRISDKQGLPRRNWQITAAIKLGSDALVERQVDTLEVVGEFDYIEQSVTCFRQYGL